MMNANQLKERLQQLQSQQFQLQVEEWRILLPAMLRYIGSPDAQLRDDLIYTALVQGIYHQRVFSTQELRAILQTVLDEQHMFYRMGEKEGDAVFTRAFSVLLLPLLLAVHRDQLYLTNQELEQVRQALFSFLAQEQDLRGFVPEKGWAHAVAHAADALDELALCDEMGQADLLEMLQIIRTVICDPGQVYIHGEEERLGTAALSILSRAELSMQQVKEWVVSFEEPVLTVKELPDALFVRANARNFLQSLYFRLRWAKLAPPYETAFDHTLRAISRYGN